LNKSRQKRRNQAESSGTKERNRFSELLEQMRANPQSDWGVAELEKLCNHFNVNLTAPTRGSHYKVSSDLLGGILTIPAKRPIKPPYIRKFVALIDAHNQQSEKGQKR
jgi:hypothetical protein